MGVPALQHERVVTRGRFRLALVPNNHRPARVPSSPRALSCARDARCRDAFTAFLVVAVAFSAFGIARVSLAARAAAVSIESGRLREQIRSERFNGDMLEIRQSALATPSRIQAIAAATMRMKTAGAASYITIDGTMRGDTDGEVPAARAGTRAEPTSDSSRPRAAGGLLASIMNTAAGEAQALLLGDVGLASSR